jgi:NUMOD1 domain
MYNILKYAGSSTGFKPSEASIEHIRASKLGRNHSEDPKLKIAVGSIKALSVIVINNNTGEVIKFISIRKSSKFMGKHYSYITKCLRNHGFYKGKYFTIFIKKT